MNEVVEVADRRWDGRSPTEARDRRTEVVGGGTVDLGGGQTRVIKVSLNAVGKRLLAARHNLKVKLLATVEVKDTDKPALVAECLLRVYA